MAALPIGLGGATTVAAANRRVFATSATKGSAAGPPPEKSLIDWIVGALQKEDQLLEVDPLLNKVERKVTVKGRGRQKSSVSAPLKKNNGGFKIGGFFSKD